MKLAAKLVVNSFLLLAIISCASIGHKSNPVDVTICSIEYDYDSKEERYFISCDAPDYTSYDLDLGSEDAKKLVCLPHTDYTRLLLEYKR